jgi:hypothetical protein
MAPPNAAIFQGSANGALLKENYDFGEWLGGEILPFVQIQTMSRLSCERTLIYPHGIIHCNENHQYAIVAAHKCQDRLQNSNRFRSVCQWHIVSSSPHPRFVSDCDISTHDRQAMTS